MSLISLVIKPTDLCNLQCKYCYHLAAHKEGNLIKWCYIEKLFNLCAEEFDMIQVVWHGGEPLLAGFEFFKNVIKLQNHIRKSKHCTFFNSIQTNGTLVDKKWITFFKKYSIHVGISYDGDANDTYRGQTKNVQSALKLLKKKKCSAGTLSVITAQNNDQVKLYEHIKMYANSAKFNPVFSPDGKKNNYLLNVDDYIASTKRLWDYWAYDTNGIPIEPFISYASKVLGVPGISACTMNSCLGKWLDMDCRGDLRFCGQSGKPFFVIGNIQTVTSIGEIFNGDDFLKVVSSAILRRKMCMSTCDWFKLCQGGCICRALVENSLYDQGGFSCKVTKSMFTYIKDSLRDIISSETSLDKINPTLKNIITSSFALSNGFINILESDGVEH